MIVICGDLVPSAVAGDMVSGVAARAAAAGAIAQLVGIVADGDAGDRRLLELAAAGVGHVAVLREAVRDLEPADLDLALRYLPDVKVVVLIALPPAVVAAAAEHVAWSGAALIVVQIGATGGSATGAAAGTEARTAPGVADPAAEAIILAAPSRDLDGTFAGFVGTLAARLDGGATPADAWAATTRELAVDPV